MSVVVDIVLISVVPVPVPVAVVAGEEEDCAWGFRCLRMRCIDAAAAGADCEEGVREFFHVSHRGNMLNKREPQVNKTGMA